jgi:hypothetical protein
MHGKQFFKKRIKNGIIKLIKSKRIVLTLKTKKL